jgi:Tol biopolymer transport system component/DNA-binding winged helix-turn-helix (wHTH) protein
MDVLVCLAERDGVVSRQQLFDACWPDTLVVDECLTRAISELRKAFGDDPRRPRVIETIPKKGYRLLAAPRPVGIAVQEPTAVPRRPRRRALAAIAAVPVLLVLAHLMGAANPPAPAAPERTRLTSLPGRERFPALSPAGDRLAFVWDGEDGGPRQALYVVGTDAGEPRRLSPDASRCAFPAWSHDARRIAYVRIGADRADLCEVPAAGGAERVLVAGDDGSAPLMPDYSPDGRLLAFSAASAEIAGRRAIHIMQLADGAARRLTDPGPPPGADLRPRFSPDGERLAYLRSRAGASSIAVVRIGREGVVAVEVGGRQVIDFVWDPSDPDVLVVTATDGLWRVPVGGGRPTLISAGDGSAVGLTSATAREMLAFAELSDRRDIWRYRLTGTPAEPEPLIASSRLDARPAWSNDGRSVSFVSDRGGTRQLWIADAEGGRPRPLTDFPATLVGASAWSPDDRRIAFEAVLDGQSKVFLIDPDGGEVTVLSDPGCHERTPSWSADGRFVYLSRLVDGEWRIGRRPAAGGPVELVTAGPGYGPISSPHGDGVTFARSVGGRTELWRVPAGGGVEEPLPLEIDGRLVGWTVRPGGIYTCSQADPAGDRYEIAFHPVGGGEATSVEITSRTAPGFDVSPDGAFVLVDRAVHLDGDIIGMRRH